MKWIVLYLEENHKSQPPLIFHRNAIVDTHPVRWVFEKNEAEGYQWHTSCSLVDYREISDEEFEKYGLDKLPDEWDRGVWSRKSGEQRRQEWEDGLKNAPKNERIVEQLKKGG